MAAGNDARRRYYTLLHVGKQQLGMADDAFEALLVRHGATAVGGRISKTTMSVSELFKAVEELRAKGFQSQPKRGSVAAIGDWRKNRIKMITALWCQLADVGAVRNRSEAAMVKWCATLTHRPRLQWASSQELNDCIEGLKSWARREGVELDD